MNAAYHWVVGSVFSSSCSAALARGLDPARKASALMDGMDRFPVVMAVQALALMREAKQMLDQAGAKTAGAKLQDAIDILDPPVPVSH